MVGKVERKLDAKKKGRHRTNERDSAEMTGLEKGKRE